MFSSLILYSFNFLNAARVFLSSFLWYIDFVYGTLTLYTLYLFRMPLEYSWTRIGKPIPQKAYLKDLNRVLVIDNVQFEDEGTYICHVRSNKGTDQKPFTFALSGNV